MDFWKYDCTALAAESLSSQVETSASAALSKKVEAEKRRDPEDGNVYTYVVFKSRAVREGFTIQDIDEYWKLEMEPIAFGPSNGTSSTSPDAKASPSKRATAMREIVDSSERRVDPEDNQSLTFRELEIKLKDKFTVEEVLEYWKYDCTSTSSSSKALSQATVTVSTSRSPTSEERRIDPDDNRPYSFKDFQQKYRGDFTVEEIEDFWEHRCQRVQVAASFSSMAEVSATSAPKADIKKMALKDWVEAIDAEWLRILPEKPQAGSGVREFLSTLEEQYDSLEQIFELYLKKGSNEKNVLDDEFFRDIEMTKIGQKRLVNQWISAHT